MVRKLLKGLFWIFIFALLLFPLGLIYRISQAEMAEYATQASPVIRQTSIGSPVQARRQDVDRYVTISGSFTSTEVAFMDLDYKKPYDIRWIVSYGDEIQEGQVLGYYYGEEVISTVEGKLENINTSSNSYLMVKCFEPLVLECTLEEETIKAVSQFQDTLTQEDGSIVSIAYMAKAKNADGTTTVRFNIEREGDTYGSTVKDEILNLGIGYPQVVVLPLDCVYQKKAGEEEPWYVRQVTEDGFLITEIQVKIPYTGKTIAVVSGIEEGQWFDSGYKKVVSGEKK